MRRIDWYFDVMSPFAYLCHARLHELRDVEIVTRPVLFGALLNHWGQKGPGEVTPKRRYTYRWCRWLADTLGVPFQFPASHPFNSLAHQRLIIAAGITGEAVRRVFDAVWTTGQDAGNPQQIAELCRALNVDPTRLAADEVKAALRQSTDEAA